MSGLVVAILGLAALHMLAGGLLTLMAGFTPSDSLYNAIARVLTFPTQYYPASLMEGWLGFLLWGLTCLAWSCLVCGAVWLAWQAAGPIAAGAVAVAVLLGVGGAIVWAANPPPDWRDTGHRYLPGHVLMLPVPLQESAEERASDYAIHRSLRGDAPYVPPPVNRWYWGYRPSISGHPEYRAVMVAATAAAAPTREAFLGILGQQRDPSWSAARWAQVAEASLWTMDSALPERAPIAVGEADRLIRVVARAPSGGVWLGLVAIERSLPRAEAAGILEAALPTVQSEAEGAAAAGK